MKLTFLGASRTVTGSRYLVEEKGIRLLVDCGLFQGQREWKNRNWDFSLDPSTVDCVLLTHAHIDHSGFLPRFVNLGFRGPVHCTPATAELLGLMLPDSGRLQEEDAAFANKKKYTKHDPALPLYTEGDALKTLAQLKPLDFYEPLALGPDFSFQFLRAGHILGSAMIEMTSELKIVFTGDLGRPLQFITKSPDQIQNSDYLVLESTYGNRLHQRIDVKQHLTEIIQRTAGQGGTLLVPAFAIGRAQELLYLLRVLEESNAIPKLQVFIDSPMAVHALPIYNRNTIDFSKELAELTKTDATPFLDDDRIHPVETVEESKKLNQITYPCIIVSSSGMATGGRVLHHLKHKLGDHRNTVLFIGFQAEGTKGRLLVDGAGAIKIHGQNYPVRAQIEYMDALSCHADYEEILQWLTSFQKAPRTVFLVHGEEQSSLSLAEKINQKYSWPTHVPTFLESMDLL